MREGNTQDRREMMIYIHHDEMMMNEPNPLTYTHMDVSYILNEH